MIKKSESKLLAEIDNVNLQYLERNIQNTPYRLISHYDIVYELQLGVPKKLFGINYTQWKKVAKYRPFMGLSYLFCDNESTAVTLQTMFPKFDIIIENYI